MNAGWKGGRGRAKTAAERTSSMTGERRNEKTWKAGIKGRRAHLFAGAVKRSKRG